MSDYNTRPDQLKPQIKKAIFHPGSYLKDIINSKNISTEEFAKQANISFKIVYQLIEGHLSVDRLLAMKLQNQTGISVDTWLNLQESFDKHR